MAYNNIYYLRVSECSECRQPLWVFCFRVSHRLQSRCSQGLPSYLKVQLGKQPLPSSLTQLLAGLHSSRVVGLGASITRWLLARGVRKWELFIGPVFQV